jgi:hypothetical protein
MKAYRHGDVIIAEIPRADVDMESLKLGTLSLGSETGHHHEISGLIGQTMWGRRNMQSQQLVLENPTEIRHPEHGNMLIPAGFYEVRHVRQWEGGRNGNGMD